MNEDDRTKEALFRHAILGDLLSRKLRRGELLLSFVQWFVIAILSLLSKTK